MDCADWIAEGREALAAVAAFAAAMDSVTAVGPDHEGQSGPDHGGPPGADHGGQSGTGSLCQDDGLLWDDPLRDLADGCLDALADMARWEARAAAWKVRVAATYLRATDALEPPAVAVHSGTRQEMAVTAEIACVLTISGGDRGGVSG